MKCIYHNKWMFYANNRTDHLVHIYTRVQQLWDKNTIVAGEYLDWRSRSSFPQDTRTRYDLPHRYCCFVTIYQAPQVCLKMCFYLSNGTLHPVATKAHFTNTPHVKSTSRTIYSSSILENQPSVRSLFPLDEWTSRIIIMYTRKKNYISSSKKKKMFLFVSPFYRLRMSCLSYLVWWRGFALPTAAVHTAHVAT